MISDHRWVLAAAALSWTVLLGCQDQGTAATQPAVRTVPPVEPRPTRPADEPPHLLIASTQTAPAKTAAPPAPAQPAQPPAPAQTASPPPAPASPLPPALIDCVTSAASSAKVNALGIQRYPWFGQSPDPESMKTGKINVSILLTEIRKKMGPDPTGWGMLDFEDPFDAWLALPATDPRNRLASSEMVKAIRAVKAEFPKVKWTYYAQPRMERVFPGGKGWANGTEAQMQAEIERRIATCSDILREVDWINPSIYDVYENSKFQGDELSYMVKNERIWREQVVKLGRTIRERMGLPQVPVIPCVSVFFQPGGRATNMKPIPIAELIEDQIDPALEGGADAFAIWTSADFFQMLATLPDSHDLNQLNRDNQRAARDAWTAEYLSGVRPRDWTDPTVKFQISQATGKTISDGAEAIVKRVETARAKPQAK